jgi:hypothetical protein
MSTFRHRFALTLDGERLEITTNVGDYLAAERFLGREKIENPVATAPMQMQLRVAFGALTRTYPEHPVARDWPKFQAALDDLEDLDSGEGEPMDPTRSEDSESWP